MRIAVTNDMHANGGAVAMMAHRFVVALRQAGHDATLITARAGDPLPTDVPCVEWSYPERGDASIFGMMRFYRQLRLRSRDAFARWMNSGPPPDLWIALVPPSALGALDACQGRIPLLYICNSAWAMEWLSAYRAAAGKEPGWLKRWLATTPRRRIEQKVVSQACAWTALSQVQLDWVSQEHPDCGHIPKVVIRAAVDGTKFLPLEDAARTACRLRHGVKAGERLLLCSRRLVPRTGVDMLIEAVATMREARLIVTGDGPERRNLELLAQKLGVAERVSLSGFIAPAELHELTASADVCVLPTRELEGFGLSAVEALACGTPVVATPVGALPDVVGGLDPRLMASEVSVAGVRAALERVLHDPELGSAEFRKRCRDYALERFDWNRLKGEFVALAERCARKKA